MTTTDLPVGARKTSHSEVESYLSCERRHYYGYGLKIQGKYTSEALERGILIHAALAAYYRDLRDGVSHSGAEVSAFLVLSELYKTSTAYDATKLMTQCGSLLNQYFDNYRDEEMEVLAVETEFLIKITDDYYLPVKIDLIYRQEGQVVVADHKVVYDFYNPDSIDLYPQLPKYLAGLMAEGYKVDRLEYNEIRHRNTKENIENPSTRFQRSPIEITKTRVLTTIEEQIRAANRIRVSRERPLAAWSKSALRHTGSCGNCSFKLICKADLNGEPTADLIEFEYRPKTQRNELNS